MYKTCFLINAGEDPFRLKGRDAEDAIRAVFPKIKGYVQARALPSAAEPEFSGSAELWFDDSSAALGACVTGIGSMLAQGAGVCGFPFPATLNIMRASSVYNLWAPASLPA